jgi:hypothetical protein
MSDLGLRPSLDFRTGGGEEPALNRGLTGGCPISDLGPPLIFGQGGGEEPALNRGLTGGCLISD